MSSHRELLKVAVEAAKKAGRLQLRHYGRLKSGQVSQKSKNDFVTVVDKASEKLIVSTIREHFSDHAVLAEESGRSSQTHRTCWIIDPLDGTSNYIHHFPMFAVSIGVLEDGILRAGVVYDALHNELFTATRGGGAFLNGRRFRVSGIRKLSEALMSTGIPFRARNRFEEYFRSLKTLSMASAGMRRGGSAALDLAYVACGRFEGFWEINLSPWDVAAGALLIQEAGGRITDVWGKQGYLFSGDILASNGAIHGELKKITSAVFTPKTDSA